MIVNNFNHLEFMVDYRFYKAQLCFQREATAAKQELLSQLPTGRKNKRKKK